MRSVLVVLALVASSTIGCVVAAPAPTPSTQGSGSGGNGAGAGGAGATSGAEAGGASCDAACKNYLQCRSADTSANRSKCDSTCATLGLDEATLGTLATGNCATVIAMVEGSSSSSSSGGSSGSSGSTGSSGSSCNGCAWDGSQCIWLSQSNWGAGPYSGAASSCDASCCPGH